MFELRLIYSGIRFLWVIFYGLGSVLLLLWAVSSSLELIVEWTFAKCTTSHNMYNVYGGRVLRICESDRIQDESQDESFHSQSSNKVFP